MANPSITPGTPSANCPDSHVDRKYNITLPMERFPAVPVTLVMDGAKRTLLVRKLFPKQMPYCNICYREPPDDPYSYCSITHLSCRTCLPTDGKCPVCRKRSLDKPPVSYQRAVETIVRLITQAPFICPNNAESCPVTPLTKQDLQSHVLICQPKTMCFDCGNRFRSPEKLADHRLTCQEIIITCPKGCSDILTRKALLAHYTFECPEAEIAFPGETRQPLARPPFTIKRKYAQVLIEENLNPASSPDFSKILTLAAEKCQEKHLQAAGIQDSLPATKDRLVDFVFSYKSGGLYQEPNTQFIKGKPPMYLRYKHLNTTYFKFAAEVSFGPLSKITANHHPLHIFLFNIMEKNQTGLSLQFYSLGTLPPSDIGFKDLPHIVSIDRSETLNNNYKIQIVAGKEDKVQLFSMTTSLQTFVDSTSQDTIALAENECFSTKLPMYEGDLGRLRFFFSFGQPGYNYLQQHKQQNEFQIIISKAR